MRFGFDHCNLLTAGPDAYRRLGERGFTTDALAAPQPGGQASRFIRFALPPRPAGGTRTQYLEFVEVPGLAPDALALPGLALGCDTPLADVEAAIREQFEVYAPSLVHRPSASGGAGWWFLTFAHNLVRRVNVWCAAYDPAPEGEEAAPPPVSHPNTADRILGVALAVPAAKLAALEALVGRECTDGRLELHDGTTVYAAEALAGTPLADGAQPHPFRAVILGCADLEAFVRVAVPDEVFTWRGRPAARVRTAPGGWDLVVIA